MKIACLYIVLGIISNWFGTLVFPIKSYNIKECQHKGHFT